MTDMFFFFGTKIRIPFYRILKKTEEVHTHLKKEEDAPKQRKRIQWETLIHGRTMKLHFMFFLTYLRIRKYLSHEQLSKLDNTLICLLCLQSLNDKTLLTRTNIVEMFLHCGIRRDIRKCWQIICYTTGDSGDCAMSTFLRLYTSTKTVKSFSVPL